MKIQSYIADKWVDGLDDGVAVNNAINGDVVGLVSSKGIDFQQAVQFAHEHGSTALRDMTFHQRANMLKEIGKLIIANKQELYEVSGWTGATKVDSWVDIEGGAGTLFSYSSVVRRELPNEKFLVEGPAEPLSAKGSFIGRHILTAKPGVAVHINAYNFPCWGMLEKLAPSFAAGMPVIVKPATVSCFLTERLVKLIISSGIVPKGALQLICGSVGDLLDHLDIQDVVTFTGSASTGQKLRTHPNIIANSIPFTMEADSLNSCVMGENVTEGSAEFDLFIKEVANEITVKAGQKCTAIRRAIVPRAMTSKVAEALKARLAKVSVGDPAVKGVRMGALVGRSQCDDVWQKVAELMQCSEVVCGANKDFVLTGTDGSSGAFFPPTVLYCDQPLTTDTPHSVEAFGPVTTLMPYDDFNQAIEITKLGKGSLVSTLVSADNDEAAEYVLKAGAYHGRIHMLNADCAGESTGHGSPLPNLVHGGPGRAGGGEELGGLRAIKHYMQRTALQGHPTTMTAVTREFNPGSELIQTQVHPFRKYFEEVVVGETLITHRRTVTEADIVNFGCLSGDHFYAHFDEQAAKDSFFGKRVAHGYFILSAAAGLFVDPGVGPVIANYGLENLRFIEPVGIGDTIKARLSCKKKIKKDKRPDDFVATGVVEWDVEVTNQDDTVVAIYSILTLVERKNP